MKAGCQDKAGQKATAYVIAEADKVVRMGFAEDLLPIEGRNGICSHGIAAQKTGQYTVCALRGCAKQFAEDRIQNPGNHCKQSGFQKQTAEQHKGKQGRYQHLKPQKKSPWGTCNRDLREKQDQNKEKKYKPEILRLSKDFNGTNTDSEVMAFTGLSRGSYYKYKRELKAEIENNWELAKGAE